MRSGEEEKDMKEEKTFMCAWVGDFRGGILKILKFFFFEILIVKTVKTPCRRKFWQKICVSNRKLIWQFNKIMMDKILNWIK